MKEARLTELIGRYFERELVGADQAELEAMLLADADARTRFWEETEWRALFGQWGRQEGARAQAQRVAQVRTRSARSVGRPITSPVRSKSRGWAWTIAFLVITIGFIAWQWPRQAVPSLNVATLAQAVDAVWVDASFAPQPGRALKAGWLRLRSGLVQVVFYSGARVAIEGPAEFQIISPSEASCRMGRLTGEVPPQARGFRIATPQMNVTDLGTVFGLDVKQGATELHVFKGSVEFLPATGSAKQTLQEGSGAVAEGSRQPRLITANEAAFASLFKLRDKSVAAESSRYDANFARPIKLGPDDVRAFPDAPAGFDKPRPDVESGRVEAFAYDSSVTGTRREANVYLPPGYSSDRKYPVLYLLHGPGGNQHEWTGYIHAHTIIGNLIADGKAVPMIVVMPNGRALPDDRPPDQIYTPQNIEGFAKFERDLLDCLIPAIQAKYSVNPGREHRALAGLSMGGGQTLNFGLGHLDTFAWVGGFSSAPNTRPGAELVPDPAAARRQLKLLYLSCGNKDGLISISQGVHAYFKQHDIPHIWNVDDHGRDGGTWGNNLYHFAQRIFRP